MSKLAALAAARKRKESARAASGDGMSGEIACPQDEQRSVSVSLLDKLASSGKAQETPESRNTRLPLRRGDCIVNQVPERKRPSNYTKAEQLPPGPAAQSVEWDGLSAESRDGVSLVPSDLRAKPSTFATIIIGEANLRRPATPSHWSQNIDLMSLFGLDLTEVYGFTDPSPDDVVLNAQSAARGNKSKRTLHKAPIETPPADVDIGIKQLSVQESVKVKSKNLDVLAEYRKAKRKNAANFVVIGHVDAGKSTLMGRLLLDLKVIDQRTVDKYRREADKIGKGSFALAWVLDQGSEERARGVTIDFATNKFETERTTFTILDAPGHRDFVPNMIAGASQADFALLVVDASTGNFESGLKGQTKEHALLVRSMGVQKMVVAINKMDSVKWSKDRFDEIEQQISSFLTAAGFQPKNLSLVPCSGLRGDNVTQRNGGKEAVWYTGRTLIDELETSEPFTHALDKPLRITISDIFRGGVQNPLSVSGRIDSGSLQVGDQIMIMPSGEKATIKGLEVDQEPSDWAVAGQNVILHLADVDPIHLKTGDVICSSASPVKNVSSFTAKVLAFDHLTPMHIDVHRGRLYIPGRITRLISILDKGSGTAVKKKPKIVAPGTVARIVVEMDQSIPLEAPGRVVLRANGETVAAGLLENN